ncbi:pantoate--beta-alanine ligase [Algoriphagus formosus]|uniref:pantoate--beta-alanine ligase n=1 Tax=Algoriphagus formosus TaxID=2007308 RepID=UPI003F705B64
MRHLPQAITQSVQVFYTGAEWSEIRLRLLQKNFQIGLVPTMGALHQGHLDLVKRSKENCGVTVVSIFVNPTQFNNPEDFAKYPQSLNDDLDLLKTEGADYVFTPSVETMYPQKSQMTLDFGPLERVLEGAFRPGHFNGVGLIVSKLFHLIQPHVAFFGQKDLQQVAIIKRLVLDLSFPIEIQTVPTRRENDGLAMSSRNRRLDAVSREKSLLLFQSLSWAKEELLNGTSWLEVQQKVNRNFKQTEGVSLEYFELVGTESFEILKAFDPDQKSSLCVAAEVGKVRLIDNLPVNA